MLRAFIALESIFLFIGEVLLTGNASTEDQGALSPGIREESCCDFFGEEEVLGDEEPSIMSLKELIEDVGEVTTGLRFDFAVGDAFVGVLDCWLECSDKL